MSKIAIYARVSDNKKKTDGERRQDVYRQVDLLKNFLADKGVKDYDTYIDDGKSAFTEDINQRPEFNKLFSLCLRYQVKEIYIEDMTRFSRNLPMGLMWLKRLGECGVNVISVKEGELEVTSSGGFFHSAIFLLIAEWSSRITSEKVKSGMHKARNLGKKIGGFRPIKVGKRRGGYKPPQNIKESLDIAEVSLKND